MTCRVFRALHPGSRASSTSTAQPAVAHRKGPALTSCVRGAQAWLTGDRPGWADSWRMRECARSSYCRAARRREVSQCPRFILQPLLEEGFGFPTLLALCRIESPLDTSPSELPAAIPRLESLERPSLAQCEYERECERTRRRPTLANSGRLAPHPAPHTQRALPRPYDTCQVPRVKAHVECSRIGSTVRTIQ